jgi:hypothetical protein
MLPGLFCCPDGVRKSADDPRSLSICTGIAKAGDHSPYHREELRRSNRLRDVVVRPGGEAVLAVFRPRSRREGDDGQMTSYEPFSLPDRPHDVFALAQPIGIDQHFVVGWYRHAKSLRPVCRSSLLCLYFRTRYPNPRERGKSAHRRGPEPIRRTREERVDETTPLPDGLEGRATVRMGFASPALGESST